MALGAANNAPGALRVGTVYVLWAMVYLFFMGIVNRPEQLTPFLKVIVIGSIGTALMAVMLVADGLFSFNLGIAALLRQQGAGLGIYDGVIEYKMLNMQTVIYALPFLLGILLMPRAWSPWPGRWRIVAWVALALSVVTLLISGRRAFLLIAAISLVVVWGLLWLCGMRANVVKSGIKGAVLGTIVIVVVLPFFDLDLLAIWEGFMPGLWVS